MGLLNSIGNKAGGLGSIVSAMGCGACFPAIASFGGAIGLGFLLWIGVSNGDAGDNKYGPPPAAPTVA